MQYECLIFGWKGVLWGLPASVGATYLIYRMTDVAYDTAFYIPLYPPVIAIGSVLVVVCLTMWYATAKIRQENPIDALKNENL